MKDTVLLEILKNRFQAAAEEMASVVLLTGHTVFVKETGDFGTALVSPDGEVFACPVNTGVSLMVGHPFQEVVSKIEFEDGDVFIANDPISTGGMATHLPDIYLWKPIYFHGELICFAWSFIHSSDIGGRVPGSIAPSSVEIFQEGFIIPPTKLYEKGVLNQGVLTLILSNCRIPEQNWGDIKALMAGLNTAEMRMGRLLETYGVDTIKHGINDVMDYAELQSRDIIRTIPDGEYVFHDYMEGDVVPGGVPIRVNLRMVVHDGELLLDFTGTDPEVRAAINLPTHSKDGHWMIAFAVISFLRTTRREIPFNSGLVRPVKVHIPKGTLLNPSPRAAVGVRAATMFRVFDCVLGVLGQALPAQIPAAGSGQGSILLVSVPDLDSGATKVSVVQPLCGGSGGRPTKDGTDGVDTAMGYLKNIPVESIESDMPIVITRYALRERSGGPGRWRGGVGVEMGFRVLGVQATITSRGMERYRFAPWGRDGGNPGTVGRTLVDPGTSKERDIGKIDVLSLDPGQELLIFTQGGGGFGVATDRNPEDVLTDVENGLVSVESAERDYRVVVRNGTVDLAATTSLRASIPSNGSAPSLFGFGARREEYDARWSKEARTHLNQRTSIFPGTLGQTIRERIVFQLDESQEGGQAVSFDQIDERVTSMMALMGWEGAASLAGRS